MRPLSNRLRRRAPGYELPNTASIEDWALTPRRPGLLLPACLLFLAALNSRNQRCSWMAWLGLGELGELGEMGSSGGEVRQGTRSRRCRRERHTELTHLFRGVASVAGEQPASAKPVGGGPPGPEDR